MYLCACSQSICNMSEAYQTRSFQLPKESFLSTLIYIYILLYYIQTLNLLVKGATKSFDVKFRFVTDFCKDEVILNLIFNKQ